DVVGYGRCGDETGTPLGDRAQPTRADQLIDGGATQRQERHRFRDAVKLLASLHGPPSWPSLWRQAMLDSEVARRSVAACHVGRRQRKLSAGRAGRVAGPGVAPVGEHQDHVLVEGAAPGVEFAVRPALALAVLGAGAAELAEGDRVAPGFGQEVAAVAEHV